MGTPYAEVIGDPVSHSKSPAIHKFWLEKLGIEGDFRARQLMVRELSDYFARRRADPDWNGCSITMPLKAAARWMPDFVDQGAQAARATNCIAWDRDRKRLLGLNTDIQGFAEPLEPFLRPLLASEKQGKWLIRADLVGVGSAARSVAVALEARYPEVCPSFYDRTETKAKAMSQEFRGSPDNGFGLDKLRGYSEQQGDFTVITLLINATPMGMSGYRPLPVDLSTYGERTIVYDLVYYPVETPLLKAAHDRGLSTISGLHMLIAQASQAFELFFGQPPPRQYDTELRELLAQ